MSILYLVFVWAGLGLIIGSLALAAHLNAWDRYGWLWILLLGAGSALAGGLLGDLLLGRLFATPVALWVAVLATCAPWLMLKLRARLGSLSKRA